MTAISSSGLTKRFHGGQLAVDHIDLAVPGGSVYGFLGPNGSGKTTTIRMLLGLAFPSSGTAALLGVPMPGGAAQVLPRVGSLVEGPAFYPFLTGAANLARYDAADRTADPATAQARIAAALDRVGLLAAAGKRAGQLVFQGSLPELRRTGAARVTVRTADPEGAAKVLAGLGLADAQAAPAGDPAGPAPGEVPGEASGEASAVLGDAVPEQVCAELVQAGIGVRGFAVSSPSLEDLFVGLTGEGFDVSG